MLNAMISKGYTPPQEVLNTVLDTCTARKNTRKVSAAKNRAAVLLMVVVICLRVFLSTLSVLPSAGE